VPRPPYPHGTLFDGVVPLFDYTLEGVVGHLEIFAQDDGKAALILRSSGISCRSEMSVGSKLRSAKHDRVQTGTPNFDC